MSSLSITSKSNKALSENNKNRKQKKKQMSKKSDEASKNLDSTSSYFKVRPEENVKSLKNNLKEKSCEEALIRAFLAENDDITSLIETKNINEKDMIQTIENTSNFNDENFEEKVVQIFAKTFNVDALNIYPYFEIVNSKKKHKKVTQISYYRITCEKNNQNSCYYFLYNRKNYLIKFSDLIIILTKSQGILNNISVLKNNYNSPRDFALQKEGQLYKICFQYREIIPELVNCINDIENLKNEIINSQNMNDKDTDNNLNNQKLDVLKKIREIYENKYKENEIIKRKDIKIKDLELVENMIKYNDLKKENDENLKDKYSRIKKEIEDLDILLTKVSIKVEKIEKELDGFFISSEEIVLTNTIGDKLVIPKQKPIILEVKNNSNYQSLIDNIRAKKNILKFLGLNDDLFFFVGILREIRINEEDKKTINKNIKDFNFTNTIIIYPQNSKLLGVSLIKEKAEQNNDILSRILKQLEEIKKDIT